MIAGSTGKRIVAVARTPPVGSVRTSSTTGSAARPHPDEPSSRQPMTIIARHNMAGLYRPFENQASTNRMLNNLRRARDRRDERDGPNEMEAQSVHVAPFSPVSRFTRHGPD